jgi:hypothetical protein
MQVPFLEIWHTFYVHKITGFGIITAVLRLVSNIKESAKESLGSFSILS